MTADVSVPHPVEYLRTGDHALLVAWCDHHMGGRPTAVLCLEDGRAVWASTDEFRFDYRYDIAKGAFVDVSSAGAEEGEDADTNQEAPDDGSQAVPGQLPDPD